MLQDRKKFMQDTQTFLENFNHYSFGVTPRVLSIAWERISKIKYVFTKSEEIPELMCKLLEDEYLEKSSDAITPVLPTEELEYSLSMGYEHLSIIPKTKSDEIIKSSAKNLLPIPSEYEVTSDDKSKCDVPDKDESSLVFTTFSNPLFDDNDDFTSSDDESLSEEDVPIEEFKFDFLEEFSGALMPTSIADKERIKREHEEYISLIERLFSINPCPRPMENSNTIIETLSTFPIPVEDKGDINVLEELLVDDSIPLPENESFYFDHQDDPSFPRPPSEPSDVEFFFDFEPNA
uniref:Reverse transcriptase domain-containing protein n=1 Tax=Tanacetum cinerariifolium TaxID=118510 RepID=A0A699H9S4_TANCI|nr:hypothetical protein [Tanacetum cinerariifolium]